MPMNNYGAKATYSSPVTDSSRTVSRNGSMTDLEQRSRYEEGLSDRRILVMGLPRSGKSSILGVIFEGILAYDTLNLIPTQQRLAYQMMTGITVYDFPGIDEYSDAQDDTSINPEVYAGENTSLIFVIDSLGDIQQSLGTLFTIMRVAQPINPSLPINIFIHKVDGLSEELKQDIQQDIQQRVLKNMGYEGLNSTYVQFFLTTIYTESIREAMSRVSQRLVPHINNLENILNSLCSKSNLDKVFLFDTSTKIYLAMDASPTDPQSYMFACQTIDSIDEISVLCSIAPADRADDMVMQKTTVVLEGSMQIFIYQVNPYLSLLCLGPSQVIRQQSLLEFNCSKVAKAIRCILTS